MVPVRLAASRAAAGAAAGLLALSLGAACGGAERQEGMTAESAAGAAVRSRYASADAVAAGAWTWTPFEGVTFVLVDVQSTVQGLVQARADLWLVTDSGPGLVGRSDVMPAAASFGAYAFDDLTADGLPDLFGYVADSAGVQYPVFIPGAQGAMTEELSIAARGWRFETGEPRPPELISGATGVCALALWAQAPAPDGRPEGWRYLRLLPGGELSAPAPAVPRCE